MGYKVAIDGPAGAGKSTIARMVAEKKGLLCRYRRYVPRAGSYFLDRGIGPEETERMEKACEAADVTIRYEDGAQQVYLNGENITGRLREEAVGNMASRCAAVPAVREKLLELQRRLAKEQDVIMDGRDIGTCVLPDADVKVFLTASVRTRAERRYKELKKRAKT